MRLYPAIDIKDGQCVRLRQGAFKDITIYSDAPEKVAAHWQEKGASFLHLVDLDGARSGTAENFESIAALARQGGLFIEVGGGIRSEETIQKYLDAGVYRVILGTAAITQPDFLENMVAKYGEKIAVGVDIKDGMVAIKGWTEVSALTCDAFCEKLEKMGVKTIICTDISKDGLLSGTNLELYRHLGETYHMDIVASGGVSSLEDVAALEKMGLYGAILGKALYTGHIDLAEAVKLAKGEGK